DARSDSQSYLPSSNLDKSILHQKLGASRRVLVRLFILAIEPTVDDRVDVLRHFRRSVVLRVHHIFVSFVARQHIPFAPLGPRQARALRGEAPIVLAVDVGRLRRPDEAVLVLTYVEHLVQKLLAPDLYLSRSVGRTEA